MSLYWSNNLALNITNIKNNLVYNGLLAFSLPIHGTFKQLHNSNLLQFRTLDEVKNI